MMLGWLRRFVTFVMAHCERCGDRLTRVHGVDYCARCENLNERLSCH
jgi:uncharacterized Zn finger protein (UPF0148 family)